MTNVTVALITAVISFVAGFLAGQTVSFRRVKDRVFPEFTFGDKWFRMALAALFLVGTGFLVNFTVTQRAYNDCLWTTIQVRGDAGAVAETNRQANEQATVDLVRGFLTVSGNDPDRASKVGKMLQQYVETTDSNNRAMAAANATRDQHPYERC